MKLYQTQIPSCSLCPNLLIIPAISPDQQQERRCKAVTYRNNVYRLIHDRVSIPVWCELEEIELNKRR